MTRKLLSIGLIAVFLAYAYHHRQEAARAVAAVETTAAQPTSAPIARSGEDKPDDGNRSTRSTTPAPASSTPAPTPSSGMMGSSSMGTMMGQYKNGTYTGGVADAFYGNVQVKVIISSGQISDVQFLQHPSDRQTSIEINNQAMPMLTQEAIQAQSANVNGVSGASATSQAFVQSLDSALQQARA